MVDIKDTSKKQTLESIQNIEQYISSISISNFKSGIPRVNFRKIKLNKFQNLFDQFKLVNLSTSYLSENIQQIDFPSRQKKSEQISEGLVINPLRKKKNDDEKPPVFENENIVEDITPLEQERIKENPFSTLNILEEDSEELIEDSDVSPQKPVLKPKDQLASEDVTFNLEAHILQEEQNVVLAPELPSIPEVKEDLISSSGKQSSFVWPPVLEKKTIKKGKTKNLNKLNKPKKKKKKSYFLSEQSSVTNETKTVENKPVTSAFPWNLTQEEQPVEEKLYSGLESDLLDIPEQTFITQPSESLIPAKTNEQQLSELNDIEKEPAIKELHKETDSIPFTGPIVYKAVFPNIAFESLSENMINDVLKNTSWFSKMLDKFNKLEFGIVVAGKGEKKAEKMFDKNGFKLTPIRIIILGGALATLGYSAWNYLLPIINSNKPLQENEKIVVKNLFKSKVLKKKDIIVDVENQGKLEMSSLVEGMSFSPITEEERFSLIQMARESLESRLDPFGQEEVLPREVVEQKKEEMKETGPVEISINRKQVELVGVISANNKNLALVNVYNADYTITEDDDKATRESKLKTSLSMAVPNRLEVSLLDPVEDWYVKLIVKGKPKGDDPIIELVKEDKKFKLKVGQKLLLPEQKEPIQAKAEDKIDSPKL